jgi:putative FmdB family regulatory protein
MPTYEYQCEACGHAFEQFQSIKAAPVKKCPECGKSKVKRLISAGAGLLFKGSGFYITDYRSDNYNKSAKADSSTPATGGGGEAKSGESKPAADAKPAASNADKPAATPAPAKSESKPAPKKSDGKK